MLIPIGKITEDKNLSAVIVYNTDLHEKKLVSFKQLKDISKKYDSVYGIKNYINNDGELVTMKNKQNFWSSLPECNGKGLPEDEQYLDKYQLIGRCYNREKRCYILVNLQGHEIALGNNEMKEMIKNEKIIGAKIGKDDRIKTYVDNIFRKSLPSEIGYEFRDNQWKAVENC